MKGFCALFGKNLTTPQAHQALFHIISKDPKHLYKANLGMATNLLIIKYLNPFRQHKKWVMNIILLQKLI